MAVGRVREAFPVRGVRRRLLRDLAGFITLSPLGFLAHPVHAEEESQLPVEVALDPPPVTPEDVPLVDDLVSDDVATESEENALPERIVWTAPAGNPFAVQRAYAELARPSRNWVGRCETLVELVTRGHAGMWPTAWAAANGPGVVHTSWMNAPLGSALYFRSNAGNAWAGHAGVKVSATHMVSATYQGVRLSAIADWDSRIAAFYSWRT